MTWCLNYSRCASDLPQAQRAGRGELTAVGHGGALDHAARQRQPLLHVQVARARRLAPIVLQARQLARLDGSKRRRTLSFF